MNCTKCQAGTKVKDSRLSEDGKKITRRRECLNCGERFTTEEICIRVADTEKAKKSEENKKKFMDMREQSIKAQSEYEKIKEQLEVVTLAKDSLIVDNARLQKEIVELRVGNKKSKGQMEIEEVFCNEMGDSTLINHETLNAQFDVAKLLSGICSILKFSYVGSCNKS